MSPLDGVWRVWVTEDDLRAARTAWAQARDDGAPVERVLDLLAELERMTRTAALQASGDPWWSSHEVRAVRVVPSVAARRLLRPPRLTAAG